MTTVTKTSAAKPQKQAPSAAKQSPKVSPKVDAKMAPTATILWATVYLDASAGRLGKGVKAYMAKALSTHPEGKVFPRKNPDGTLIYGAAIDAWNKDTDAKTTLGKLLARIEHGDGRAVAGSSQGRAMYDLMRSSK